MESRECGAGPERSASVAGAAGAAGAPDGGPGGAGGSGTGSGRTVPVTVTYLEMRSPDQRSPAPGVMEPTAILRAERPTISF